MGGLFLDEVRDYVPFRFAETDIRHEEEYLTGERLPKKTLDARLDERNSGRQRSEADEDSHIRITDQSRSIIGFS